MISLLLGVYLSLPYSASEAVGIRVFIHEISHHTLRAPQVRVFISMYSLDRASLVITAESRYGSYSGVHMNPQRPNPDAWYNTYNT